MEARCTESDCILDCMNTSICLDGTCFSRGKDTINVCQAYSDVNGTVKFTDLYMDEDKFDYTIEFIFDGQNPSAGGIWNGANAAIKVIVDWPITPSSDYQYGLFPFFPQGLTVIAGEMSGMVSVEYKDVDVLPIRISKAPLYAEPYNWSSTIAERVTIIGAKMTAEIRPACISKEAYCNPPDGVLPTGCKVSETVDPNLFCDNLKTTETYPQGYIQSPYAITCCKLANCDFLLAPDNQRCCDCSRPECSLCQVPGDGAYVPSFRFIFTSKGQYNIKFKLQIWDGKLQHAYTDTKAVFTVISVSYCKLTLVCSISVRILKPNDKYAIGHIT